MRFKTVSLGLFLLILLVCLGGGLAVASGVLASLGPATEDVYVDQADPETNQDTNMLSVVSQNKSCTSGMAYLKFNVGTGAAISGWQLRLQAYSTNPNSNIGVYGVGNNWGEITLTYQIALDDGLLPTPPLSQTMLTSLTMTGSAGLVTWPISSTLDAFINLARDTGQGGTGIVSLALAHTSCNPNFVPPWNNVFCDKEAAAAGSLGCAQAPLPVSLAAVSASSAGSAVTLEWTTGSEVDSEGFNVWRSEVDDGEYVKVNEELILAQGNASTGASYSFVDSGVEQGKTYYYKLEDVSTSGAGVFHDPVAVTVRAAGKKR